VHPMGMLEDYLLTPATARSLQIIYCVAGPGEGSGPEPYSHVADEECVVVLSGRLEVGLGQRHTAWAAVMPCCSTLRTRTASSTPGRNPRPCSGSDAPAVLIRRRPSPGGRPRRREARVHAPASSEIPVQAESPHSSCA